MNYGGGFDGGFQNVGGGGGFMTEDSPTVDSSQSKKKQRDGNQTMMPVTAAMVYKSEYDRGGETFKFGNIELHQVKIVGVIREVQESVTNLLYKIDDMTGDSLIVRRWIDNDENEAQGRRRSECREDTFVKVYGHLKIFQEKRCLVAFLIAPVTDFNEITYHMIDVVRSFLTVTKGLPAYNAITGANTGMETPGGFNSFKGGSDAFGGGQSSGMSTHQQQVLDSIMAYPDEQGISVHELKSKLRGMNDTQVRNALEFLSSEGHIYSTIDEDHFRSTAM